MKQKTIDVEKDKHAPAKKLIGHRMNIYNVHMQVFWQYRTANV
jgi:hypothetical protein